MHTRSITLASSPSGRTAAMQAALPAGRSAARPWAAYAGPAGAFASLSHRLRRRRCGAQIPHRLRPLTATALLSKAQPSLLRRRAVRLAAPNLLVLVASLVRREGKSKGSPLITRSASRYRPGLSTSSFRRCCGRHRRGLDAVVRLRLVCLSGRELLPAHDAHHPCLR
jgi:hypothetical protein